MEFLLQRGTKLPNETKQIGGNLPLSLLSLLFKEKKKVWKRPSFNTFGLLSTLVSDVDPQTQVGFLL